MIRRHTALVCAAAALSCAQPPEPADEPPEPEKTCVPPRPELGRPRDVAQLVELIDALPRPVTIACVLESLERPLRIHATSSAFSAQPADGARSPRVFVFFEPLILSIVPDGDAAHLLEMSVVEEDLRSLKGEIPFPIVGELPEDEAFTHVLYREGATTCGFCHAAERPSAELGAPAFVSGVLRPPERERVPLEALRGEHDACDPDAEPDRCAILDGLFGWGEVRDGEFPSHWPTFF